MRSSAAIAPRFVPGSDEDDCAGGRVDLVVAERERRAAADDDVHLLVVVALEVLFDHPFPGVAGVRIGAEGGDPEPPADGPEDEGAVRIRDRQLLQLVDVHHLVAFARRAFLSHDNTAPKCGV